MQELPTGTVTFLFSDVEGSTRLLQRLGDDWADVLGEHNRIMRNAFSATGGAEVDRQGDAFFAVFARARHAIAAAAQAQRELAAQEWPDGVEVRVRMGLHTGEPGVGDEGYLGLDVVRGARICAAAHGGQVIVSETTAALVRGDRLEGLELRGLGEYELKDLAEPERLYQLVIPGLPAEFDPPRTAPATSPEPVGTEAPEPLADWVANPEELTRRAVKAFRGLDLGALDQLGPRIERQVEQALRQASVPDRQRAAVDLQAAQGLQKVPGGMNAVLAIAAASLLFVALVVIGLVILLVWLL